jgi:excisionase family DNA binding protein
MSEKASEYRQTETVRDVARRLGIGLNQAYAGIKRGDIPAIRVGRRWLVLRTPLQRLLDGDL